MGVVIVALLGVLWAWILVPGAVRERRATSPHATVSGFQRTMALLGRTRAGGSPTGHVPPGGAGPRLPSVGGVPVEPGRMARRRQIVLRSLTSGTSLSLVATWAWGGAAVAALWCTSILLVAYLGALTHRWIRLSRRRAAPLLRAPGLEAAAIAARAERWRTERHGPAAPEPPGSALLDAMGMSATAMNATAMNATVTDAARTDSHLQPQSMRLVRW